MKITFFVGILLDYEFSDFLNFLEVKIVVVGLLVCRGLVISKFKKKESSFCWRRGVVGGFRVFIYLFI